MTAPHPLSSAPPRSYLHSSGWYSASVALDCFPARDPQRPSRPFCCSGGRAPRHGEANNPKPRAAAAGTSLRAKATSCESSSETGGGRSGNI